MKRPRLSWHPCLITLGGWLFLPSAMADEFPLERLFFTPEQRQNLDQQRRHDPSALSPRITLNGIVRRSSGKTSLWINGNVQHRDQAPGSDLPQRVGESIGTATGEAAGLLPPGSSIKIHPIPCSRAGTRCPGR